jgi:hypothetical protein
MKYELYEAAKEGLKDRLEYRGDKTPRNGLGWWIRLHFTDDGQLAIMNAVGTQKPVETIAPTEEPVPQTDQLPEPPSPQLSDS